MGKGLGKGIGKGMSKGMGMMSGRSAADSSKDKWQVEFNQVLGRNLLLLYVYLFGDLAQDYDKDAALASLKSNNEVLACVCVCMSLSCAAYMSVSLSRCLSTNRNPSLLTDSLIDSPTHCTLIHTLRSSPMRKSSSTTPTTCPPSPRPSKTSPASAFLILRPSVWRPLCPCSHLSREQEGARSH
jgi:hypothetical protein